MLATLIISLCLGTKVHAESIAPSTFTSTADAIEERSLSPANSSSFLDIDVDVELDKIATTCLTSQNYEQLAGNIVRYGVVRSLFGVYLVRQSVATIGLTELRAALGFAPPRPWQRFNRTEPSEDELSATPTMEAYYDMREPRSMHGSLDSYYVLERNLIPAIAYLDERFPVIRTLFRQKFRAILQQNPELTDRKIVDHFIDEFDLVKGSVYSAFRRMFARGEECFDLVH